MRTIERMWVVILFLVLFTGAAVAQESAAETDPPPVADAEPAGVTTADEGQAPAEPVAADESAGAVDQAETEPPAAASSGPACEVRRVHGTIQWRGDAAAEWRAAEVGDELSAGADLRTGFRATCLLEFHDEASQVEVQPLTILRIGEFEVTGDEVRTRLYVKQGSARAVVERTRFKSDFAIVTPEVTLAVGGTWIIEARQHRDSGPRIGLTGDGRLNVTGHASGRPRSLRPGDTVFRDLSMPIWVQKSQRVVPVFDTFGGWTPSERSSITQRAQTFAGIAQQMAPGGLNRPGGGNPRTLLGDRRQLLDFFHQYPDLLSQFYSPTPSEINGYEEGR